MAGAPPDPNPNGFNPQPLFNGLTSIIGLMSDDDRAVLATIYEQLQRAATDLYHDQDQINDSKSFIDVPTFTQRDWLSRDLSLAEFIGTPHGHFDTNDFVAAGGELTFAIGRPLDPSASYLWIDGTQVPQGQGWTFDTSNPLLPTITLVSPALAGQVFRVYAADAVAVAGFTGNGVTKDFAFPSSVVVSGIRIFHDNVELTAGITIRRREVLFMGGLTGGQVVRFQEGAKTHNVTASSGQVRVTVPFDITAATSIRLSGINIRDPYVLDADSVTFKTAPRSGVTIRITGPKVAPHDHLAHSEVTTLAQTTVTVPTDLGLDAGFVYNVDKPVLVFINGALANQSLYSFTAADTITFGVPFLAGEVIHVFYHDSTEFSHAHPTDEQVLVTELPAGTPISLGFLKDDAPALVLLDGVTFREGTGGQTYQVQGATILFGVNLLAGTRILIIGEKFQWSWLYGPDQGFDREIKSIEAIQNGIDYPTDTLAPGTDFIIYANQLFLDRIPDPIALVWFKNVQLDLSTPFNNFGYLIDFEPGEAGTTREYVDLLKSLWAAFVGGSTHWVMENFGRVMLGSPIARFPGVVQAVSSPGDETLIDILGDDGVLRQFTFTDFPPAVSPGDTVTRFTALGGGMNVIDSTIENDWYLRFALFLYAVEGLSANFEVAALWDKGLRSTYKVSASAVYDVGAHSIQITKSAFDFRLLEDLNNSKGRASLIYPAERRDTRVSSIVELPGAYEVFFDPSYPFLVAPPGTLPQVEFEFERQRRFDLDFVFDEYIHEHLDPVATQVFSMLESNLFLVDLESTISVSQERFDLLVRLLDRVKAAETDYIVLGNLPGIADDSNLDITEDDPTSALNFVQIPAYLVTGIGAYGINYTGP